MRALSFVCSPLTRLSSNRQVPHDIRQSIKRLQTSSETCLHSFGKQSELRSLLSGASALEVVLEPDQRATAGPRHHRLSQTRATQMKVWTTIMKTRRAH